MHGFGKGRWILSVISLSLAFLTGCGNTQKISEAMKLIGDLEYEEALTCLDEAQQLGENTRLVSRGKGIAYLGLTQYEEAITYFLDALADSDGIIQNVDYDLNYYLAESYIKTGNFQAAEDAYDAILSLRPKEKNAYFYRGGVRLSLQDIEGAKEDFDKVLEMEPSNYDRVIAIYEALAQYGYQTIGQEYLNNVFSANEKQMTAYDCGRFYYYLGNYQKAHIALEEAKAKGGAESYLYLGKAYEATGDYNYAASVYSSYLAKEGGNAKIYNQLGLCEINRGDYRKALEAFQQGLQLEEKEDALQELSFNEIVTYEYLGEYKEALNKINAYLKKYPEDGNAQREQIFLSTR